MSMCVALLAGAVDGFWSILRRILHGRPRGEKGLKAVRKEVIVETGMDISLFGSVRVRVCLVYVSYMRICRCYRYRRLV